jgi:signal transduction histidine kinase
MAKGPTKLHSSGELLQAVQRMIAAEDDAALLRLALDAARDIVDYEQAAALLADERELCAIAWQGAMPMAPEARTCSQLIDVPCARHVIGRQRPLLIQDTHEDTPSGLDFRRASLARLPGFSPQIRTWVGVPITLRDGVLGLFSLGHSLPNAFTRRQVRALLPLASGAGIALEHLQLMAQTKELSIAVERQRVARELHDSVAQSLYSITLFAESIRRMIESGRFEQTRDTAQMLKETALDALGEMRLIIHALRLPQLTKLGLVGALKARLGSVEERAGIRAGLEADEALEIPLPLQQELFRVASEALNNVIKHARASSVHVRLWQDGSTIQLVIKDDGIGFDLDAVPRGEGLEIMGERVAALGGSWQIDSARGRGARISFSVPASAGGTG